jgi:hypothetical protein
VLDRAERAGDRLLAREALSASELHSIIHRGALRKVSAAVFYLC